MGDSIVGFGTDRTSQTGSSIKYLDLSAEGFNKTIKDILASDAGLAALATGENLSGGYGSSVKAQLAQDLVLDIAGKMAQLTAPTVEKNKIVKKNSSAGVKTVICTELERQGLLNTELYNAGHAHFLSLPAETVAGYRVWANKVVPLLRKYPHIARTIAPLVTQRYEYIVHNRFSVFGWLTVAIAQPICFVIGSYVLAISGDENGDLSATA